MPGRSVLPTVNRLLGGELERDIRQWVAARVSYTAMANLLAERNIHVSPETIRRWAQTFSPSAADSSSA